MPHIVGQSSGAEDPALAISTQQEQRMRAHLENLRKLRAAGKPVYTVHLKSFKELARAREFATDVAREQNWGQPVFMERSDGGTVWYRVFAGELGKSSDALAWIAELKSERQAGLRQFDED